MKIWTLISSIKFKNDSKLTGIKCNAICIFDLTKQLI